MLLHVDKTSYKVPQLFSINNDCLYVKAPEGITQYLYINEHWNFSKTTDII